MTAESRNDLKYPTTAPTVRTLWRDAGIPESRIEPAGAKYPLAGQKGFEGWVAPTIFLSAAFLSHNASAAAIALNVISNYVSDFLKGFPANERKMSCDIVVEIKPGAVYKRVRYSGDPKGLSEVPAVVEALVKGGGGEVGPDDH
jgi:hypothetical protein